MEINVKLIVLALSVLLTGLTAGLCFTWSNAVTPGLARLDDANFLKAFKSINRLIVNTQFIIVFFGPILLLFLNTYLNRNSPSLWLFLAAAVLFFVGIGLVTVFGNVPLNDLLDQSNLHLLSKDELSDLRTQFEYPWNQWHRIRTLTSCLSFTLLIVGMLCFN